MQVDQERRRRTMIPADFEQAASEQETSLTKQQIMMNVRMMSRIFHLKKFQ